MSRINFLLVCAGMLGCTAISQAQTTLTCNSDDGKRHYCNADTRGGVQLSQQVSGSACVQGSTWDFDNNGIWVDRGCRARFTVGGNYGNNNQNNNGGFFGNQNSFGTQTIRCSSDDGHRHTCRVNTAGGVTMARQVSGSVCEQGRSWGYDARSVWVDHGCRADFAVGGNNGYNNNNRYNNPAGNARIVRCSSDDGNRHYCNADTTRGVILSRQISGDACQQGSTWGFDNRGIWVDRGCRADFQTGAQ
ncbi:MAG: DUF3011 domain-containing protein [Acidobacteriota bacterium]|nr:DUF3011 domain-containing protein [Acidobacteriota bacterium]